MAKKFLHFTKWNIGELDLSVVYDTRTWGLSHYWKSKLEGNAARNMEVLVGPLAQLKNISVGELNLGDALIPYLRQLKYSSELLKEYIFEEVRVSRNSSLPSRSKCMYVFDEELDPKEYSRKIGFNHQEYTLVEIEPVDDYVIHRGKLELLDCNMKSHDQISMNARTYWEGDFDVGLQVEVLFEGKFRVSPLTIG